MCLSERCCLSLTRISGCLPASCEISDASYIHCSHILLLYYIVSCSLSNVVSISCLIYWLSMPPAAVHSNFVSDDQSSPELKLTRLQLERLWLPAHLSTYSTKKMSSPPPSERASSKTRKTIGARWSCNLIAVFVVCPIFRREGGIFECPPLPLFSGVGLRR